MATSILARMSELKPAKFRFLDPDLQLTECCVPAVLSRVLSITQRGSVHHGRILQELATEDGRPNAHPGGRIHGRMGQELPRYRCHQVGSRAAAYHPCSALPSAS